MSIDTAAAERFILTNARLLDRHRLAVLMHAEPPGAALAAVRAYRNPDGGFGHGLEPDVRSPHSEPASTLHALDVLVELGASEDPMVAGAAAWIAEISDPDGGVPMVMPTAGDYPHAPWMVPSHGGSQLTFALAAVLLRAGARSPWLEAASEWCWQRIDSADGLSGYSVKFGLAFLDRVGDEQRAAAAIERLRERLDADGSLPVPGGLEHERLRPLTLSPDPGLRSRGLFTEQQIAAELDELERGQREDGGWTFDWLAWSPGQELEWRGALTLGALRTLREHGRI